VKREGLKTINGKPLPKPEPAVRPTVNLSGEVSDRARRANAPVTGVIVSQKEWDVLADQWDIKDNPRVDFRREILVVGVSDAESFTLTPTVKDGDLTIVSTASKATRDGFRWKVVSVPRAGLKTVNGKPLPRE
jgi:hypothetical protein